MDYKKYSLENLEKWIEDAINSSEASPQEIFDVIKNVVTDNYYCYKNHTARCYELLSLLNGGNHIEQQVREHGELWAKEDVLREREYYEGFGCDKDDKSSKYEKIWNDFWEENYYPEEYQKHSEEVKDDCMPPWGHSDMEALRYTEEELNAMCDKAASEQDKVVKWQLPVEVDGLTGDCFIQFPDDLLEVVNLKEGDTVSWIDRKDGSFELRKVNGTK
jgi:hypothetical protein